MRIVFLADQHFGWKVDSPLYLDYQEKFYREVFFPYLDANPDIKTIIDLGDTFDNRKSVNYKTLARAKEFFFDEVHARGLNLHIIIGNHTTYHKNTNEINSPELLLQTYQHVKVYATPKVVKIHDTDFAFVPWINAENEAESIEFIKSNRASLLAGHLELKGYQVIRGIASDVGYDASMFTPYDMVFTGHFHNKHDDGKIFYLGTSADMSFADIDEIKGFHTFDLTTRKLEFIENPNKLFYRVIYDDATNDYTKLPDFSKYAGAYVKLVIKKKTNPYNFERFRDALDAVNPVDVQPIDETDLVVTEDDIDQTLDTVTIISNEIDTIKEIEKPEKLKKIMHDLYTESFDIV
jgi:hypothetical protein